MLRPWEKNDSPPSDVDSPEEKSSSRAAEGRCDLVYQEEKIRGNDLPAVPGARIKITTHPSNRDRAEEPVGVARVPTELLRIHDSLTDHHPSSDLDIYVNVIYFQFSQSKQIDVCFR